MARSNISVGMNRSLSPTITIIFLGLLFVALAGQSHAAEWASLKGRFVFDGDPPAATEITADKDVEVCGKHKLVNEELVVSDGKGIANVVLFVRSKGVTVHPDLEDGSKLDPLVLDNKDCRFQPHVGFVQTGQTLTIKNSDPVGHNSNIATMKNSPSNSLVPSNGSSDVTFSRDEAIPASVTCNIHPWMKAYLVIRPNPYGVVTGADGSFEIENLPVGEELEFQLWHEKGGYLDEFTLDGKKTAAKRGRIDFTVEEGGTDLGDIVVDGKVFN
jgi:plastocyanin